MAASGTSRTAAAPDAAATLAELARALVPRLPELADRLVAELLRTDEGYREVGHVPLDELREACHRSLRQVVDKLVDPDLHTPGFVAFLAETGRRRQQQGLPLESLLHAYRMGGRLLWAALVEEARQGDHAQVEALLDGATRVWAMNDASSVLVADGYRAAEAEQAWRSRERRNALIDALLDGRGAEPAVAREAATALRLPDNAVLAIVVAEHPTPDAPPARGIDAALSTLVATAAWRRRADRDVGLIALGSASVETVARTLRPLLPGRAGVSPPVEGLADVPAAHRLAELALATIPPTQREIVVLEERLPAALLAAAPDLTRLLIERTLRPVLNLDAGDRELLLETLASYLETGSATRTAERLYCHRNTVLNRLRRLEALTGRSLASPDDVVVLALALRGVELQGA